MDRLSGWCKSERKLKDHTVVVTGSNSGIGKETALDLYSRGARVIMACRDVNKAETVKQEIEKEVGSTGGALVVEKLDLSRLTSVREFAERLLAREARVQLLINNAGVFMPPQKKTEDGFEVHMGTNHFGHALLTLLLLPRIIESAPARIVFVASTSYRLKKLNLDKPEKHRNPRNSFMDYARSKTANVLFAKALAMKLKEYGIHDVTTYSLHPGIVSTNIARNQIDRSSGSFKSWLINTAFLLFLKSPKCGAQTTIYCAVEEACGNESGLYYSDCAVKKTWKYCRKKAVIEKFWEFTMSELGLEGYNPFTSNKNVLFDIIPISK